MLTRDTATELVKQFIKEALENKVVLQKVILFGSYARNQAHAYSDIDVALVADSFIGFPFEDMKLFGKLITKYKDIEAHTFPTDYFEKGDPFVNEIKKTGIQLFPFAETVTLRQA
jgi:uncharacterized protein